MRGQFLSKEGLRDEISLKRNRAYVKAKLFAETLIICIVGIEVKLMETLLNHPSCSSCKYIEWSL
jgi:hypothetical protein